jgi:hypothetical protein
MIAAHLTAYRGLLGLAIQAMILNSGSSYCGPVLFCGILDRGRADCFRLLTAFLTLESEHLAF